MSNFVSKLVDDTDDTVSLPVTSWIVSTAAILIFAVVSVALGTPIGLLELAGALTAITTASGISRSITK